MTLPSSSRALVVSGAREAKIEELPMPGELDGGAIGEVLAAGVCGSDLALYNEGPLGQRLWPVILGHENIVRLVQIDDSFAQRWGVRVGDRVAVEEFIPCGHCKECLSGNYRRCPRTDYNSNAFLRYGRTPVAVAPGLWGGFSEYIYVHRDAGVHMVPQNLSNIHAPLFVPFANGVRWVTDVGRAKPGETVVILGPGAHGIGCVMAAKEIGANKIIVVGLSSDKVRLEAAMSLGATHALCADRDDVEASVREITGSMADLAIEVTSGAPGAPKLAGSLVGVGGRVVIAGGSTCAREGIAPELIIKNELQISGVRGHDIRSIVPALAILGSGRYDLDAITTKSYSLEEAQRALEEFEGNDSNSVDPSVDHERAMAFVVVPSEA